MAGSRRILRRRFGVPVNNFCYPLGRYDTTVISAVHRAGYVGAQTEIAGVADAAHSLHHRSDRDPALRRPRGLHLEAPVRRGDLEGTDEFALARARRSQVAGGRPARRRREAPAAFSTRLGGVSEGPFESLNLGRLTGDLPDAVRENRHRLAAAIAIDPELVLIGRQVHGAEVARHDQPPEPARVRESGPGPARGRRPGNGAARPGAARLRRRLPAGGARGAWRRGDDPLRLARPGGRDRRARRRRGRGASRRRSAPGSAPAATRWVTRCWPPSSRWGGTSPRAGCSTCAEQPGACSSGPGSSAVEVSEECTSCQPELFFSHRRDGERTGRQAGLVCRA